MSNPEPDHKLLREYEQLRCVGCGTMSNFQRVRLIAAQLGYVKLANATQDEYLEILDYYRKHSSPIDSI